MRRIFLGMLVAGVLGGFITVQADSQAEKSTGGEVVHVQGEILDMSCYGAHEGQGKGHQKCAKACLMGGVPAGLLTKEGVVYLLVDDHKNTQPLKQAKKWAAEQVRITGRLYKRGNMSILVVDKVEKA